MHNGYCAVRASLMPKLDKLSKEQKLFAKSKFKTSVKVNDIFIKHHEICSNNALVRDASAYRPQRLTA